jgi:hypothetical protein
MSLAFVAMVALTTYLLLDRNHAEEVGSGSRVAADAVGAVVHAGQALPLALVLAVTGLVAQARTRRRAAVGIGARQA